MGFGFDWTATVVVPPCLLLVAELLRDVVVAALTIAAALTLLEMFFDLMLAVLVESEPVFLEKRHVNDYRCSCTSAVLTYTS